MTLKIIHDHINLFLITDKTVYDASEAYISSQSGIQYAPENVVDGITIEADGYVNFCSQEVSYC